jgi:hypothetical protein
LLPSSKTARLPSSAASDNATVAFNGPVVLRTILGQNTKASTVFLKLYALGANLAVPTSADTPILTLAIPAASAFAIDLASGLKFNFGLGYRITTGSADNDAVAIGAGDILGLNLLAS